MDDDTAVALEFAHACGRGDEDAVKKFLARGIDPNIKTQWGTTPLEHAQISGRYPHIEKILLDAGAIKRETGQGVVTKTGCGLSELLKYGAADMC